MVAAGLLSEKKGWPKWQTAFGKVINLGGAVTTFGLTPALVDLAASFGVEVEAWKEHWHRTSGDAALPARLPDAARLVLRASKERKYGKMQPSRDLPIDPSDALALRLLSELDELNAYIQRQSIGGIAVSGLRRIFNNGDQPGFAWNKGGRYYSLPGGHYYEAWPSEKRRETIMLDGEAVDEADLRASHLTLLHALMGLPFGPHDDAYKVGEWPRAVVKAWVSQAIGSSNPVPDRWSATSQADFEAERPGQFLGDQFPIRLVGAEVKARHPLLIELGTCGIGPLDLQFHEAEIVRLAMEDLMLGQGITVLPIHDALIAPRSKLQQASDAIVRAFGAYVASVIGSSSKVVPKVTFKDRRA